MFGMNKVTTERLLYLLRSGLYECDVAADGMLVFRPVAGVPGTLERFHVEAVMYIELSAEQLQAMSERLDAFRATLPVTQTPITINWLQDTIDDQIAPRAAGGPVTPGVTYEISAGTDPEDFMETPDDNPTE